MGVRSIFEAKIWFGYESILLFFNSFLVKFEVARVQLLASNLMTQIFFQRIPRWNASVLSVPHSAGTRAIPAEHAEGAGTQSETERALQVPQERTDKARGVRALRTRALLPTGNVQRETDSIGKVSTFRSNFYQLVSGTGVISLGFA